MSRFIIFLAFLVTLTSTAAQGAVIITARQVGNDVVLTGSGSINTTGLSYLFNASWILPALDRQSVRVGTGSALAYTGFSGPSSVGPGLAGQLATSASGDAFGLTQFNGRLFVPVGYVSESPLSGTALYANATFASIGISEGVYTYTWGSGANADSLTIDIAVPEPAGL